MNLNPDKEVDKIHNLILKNKEENFSIKKLHYAGCPRWNYLDLP